MDIVLLILGILLILTGIVGCFVPVLPGPPLSYLGLLLLHFTKKLDVSLWWLIIFAVLVIIVQVIDYILPILGIKRFGATKYGIWGAAIGMIVGLFFGPVGAMLGIALGAVIGELTAGQTKKKALKAGAVTFIATIIGIGIKLMLSGFITATFIGYAVAMLK